MTTPATATSAPDLGPLVSATGAAHRGSYAEIVKSSSIIGGAQVGRLIVGLLQTKLAAILLGPSGVGLVGLYQGATALVGTVSGLGIDRSAVREVAEAHGSGNPERASRTVQVLHRACWATGLLGWLLTALLAWPLSIWTFGTPEHAIPIAVLGAVLLLTSITSGQLAVMQGLRRIGDLARFQLQSAVPGAIISVGLYAWLGEQGIVPALIIVAGLNLCLSWRIARRVSLVAATATWRETLQKSARLVSLGLAFMWSALMLAGVALTTRAWIVRDLGTDANGIYLAALAISGVFSGFVLQAMSSDFYPRLTALGKDNAEVNRLVNEQTEVGILLALPGLFATLALAPWTIRLLYTAEFAPAGALLPWFVLGTLCRLVSWPLGFIQLAKGNSRVYVATETAAAALLLLLTWAGLRWWQLAGVGVAFAVHCGIYVIGIRYVAGSLSGFKWSGAVRRLILQSAAAVAAALLVMKLLPPLIAPVSGGVLIVTVSYLCLLGVTERLGPNHGISRSTVRLRAAADPAGR